MCLYEKDIGVSPCSQMCISQLFYQTLVDASVSHTWMYLDRHIFICMYLHGMTVVTYSHEKCEICVSIEIHPGALNKMRENRVKCVFSNHICDIFI